MYILGTDVGTNSFGAALVDLETMVPITSCVRIFSDGRHPKNQKSGAQQRRVFRSQRKLIRKKKARVVLVSKILTRTLPPFVNTNIDGVTARHYLLTNDVTMSNDANLFSAACAAFTHLAKNRGFQSVKIGYVRAAPRDEHRGTEMYRLRQSNVPSKKKNEHKNGKRTNVPVDVAKPLREHIEDELEAIYRTLMIRKPDIFTDHLYKRLHRAIIVQRFPCKQEHLRGECAYMATERRTLKQDDEFQCFRIRAALSNLQIQIDNNDPIGLFTIPSAMNELESIYANGNNIELSDVKRVLKKHKASVVSRSFMEDQFRHPTEDDLSDTANISNKAAKLLYAAMRDNAIDQTQAVALLADTRDDFECVQMRLARHPERIEDAFIG